MKKITVLILTLFLCACVGGKSRQAQFYQIKSVSDVAVVSTKNLSIGVDLVDIPSYIDRPQIVTFRDDSMELDFAEFERWAEPLSATLPRILADDLYSYLPKSLIKVKRTMNEPFTYNLAVEINKFDAAIGKQAELDAWWTVYKNNKIVIRKRSKLVETTGKSYDEIVESMSKLIGQLSEEIAKNISELK